MVRKTSSTIFLEDSDFETLPINNGNNRLFVPSDVLEIISKKGFITVTLLAKKRKISRKGARDSLNNLCIKDLLRKESKLCIMKTGSGLQKQNVCIYTLKV